MNYSKNIKSFSFAFLLVVLVLNSINIGFDLNLESFLALNPQMVLQEYQFWRLLSFPFILTNPMFIFFFAVIFLFISPILENYLNKYLYPAFLFLASMLQGFVLTLAMWQKDVNLSGLEGIAFFVLSLLVFLKPKSRVASKLPLSVASIGIFTFVLWVVSVFLPVSGAEQISFAETSASAIFGISLGVFIYFPIKYMEKYLQKRRKNVEPQIFIPKPEELSMAMMSASRLKQMYHQFEEESTALSDCAEENENILNQILDKINSSGKESLSADELRFLDDYSRQP